MSTMDARAVGEIVGETGVWFSGLGVPRAAGQMFGYLLVCDPAEQSAGQIAAGTGMSRASVSSSGRLLGQMGAVEERHRVGDRKTYYRLRTDWWIEVATTKLTGFEQLAATARRIRAAGGLTRTDGLDEMVAFSEFWQREISQLAKRWEQQRQTRKEGS